jgi:hypothetical protein
MPLDPNVEAIVTVGRSATGAQHLKTSGDCAPGSFELRGYRPDLSGFQACFFCLGVTSAGMTERDYEQVTYGITLAAAETSAGSIRRWCLPMSRAPGLTAPSMAKHGGTGQRKD